MSSKSLFVEKRLKNLKGLLKANAIDALLIEKECDLFYLTGRHLSCGKIIVSESFAWLIVDQRYYESCLTLKGYEIKKMESLPLERLFEEFAKLGLKKIGFDSSSTSYASYLDYEKAAKKVSIEWAAVASPLQSMRAIKDDDELEKIAAANALCAEGYDYVRSILKEGVKELEIAKELEIFWLRRGSEGVAFEPIIAFGANTSMPHYRAGKARLKKGDTVLIDIGVKFQGYTSDMSRTLFFGAPQPVMLEIYNIVLEAQLRALAACKAGVKAKDLDKAARDFIAEKGYGTSFIHSLGHGLGIEVHEFPTLKSADPQGSVLLKAGMVVTIEPGIYLPGVGGVRIEDTIVIADEGALNLTNRSKELVIVENR